MTYERAAEIIKNTWWMSKPWDMEEMPPEPEEIKIENIWDEAMKMAYDTLIEKTKNKN